MNTPSKPFSQPALHSQPAPGRAPTRAVCPPSAKPSAKPSQVQCSFFMQGRCTRGSSCKFSHDATDLQKKPRRSRGARPNDKIAERTSSSRRGKNPQHGPEKRWGALVRMYSRDGSGLMTPTVLLPENELLGDPAAKSDAHLVLQVAPGVKAALEPLLAGGEEGQPSGRAPRDDADLGDGVVLRHEGSDNGVPRLVVSHQLPLLVRHHGLLLLWAGDDPLQSVRDLLL